MSIAMEKSVSKPAYRSDEDRWEAVRQRDKTADGTFYYGVATTGVYCRPSCAARPARRENVSFHATSNGMIEETEEPPTLEAIAGAVGLSSFHFHRIFKTVTGLTPKAYANAHRADRVRRGLGEGARVTETIYEAGFGSSSRFYEQATAMLGMTPQDYRDGGRNSEIRFAVGECSLGSFLVAATARGVCAIKLSDDPGELVRDLQDRFPKAKLVGDDAAFDRLVAQVVAAIEAPRKGADLPLDVRGTAFQQRVWQALRQIRRVVPTRRRSRFPVIAWCARMAGLAGTAGVSSASVHCSTGRPCDDSGRARTAGIEARAVDNRRAGRPPRVGAYHGRYRCIWSGQHRPSP